MRIGLFDQHWGERRERERFEREIVGQVRAAHNFARWIVGDHNDAEDVVQEATLRAFKSYGSFRGGDVRSWFLSIVRNTCMNHLRARNRRIEFELEDSSVAHPAPSAVEVIERQLDGERLRRAIDALPPALKELLILREFEQMSYAELAAVADIPIGTVMSRLSRARERLRVALCEEEP